MNTPEQNIVEILKDKKILFLENSDTLENGLDEFERILQRNNIIYKIIFNLSEKDIKSVFKEIKNHDALIFMTTWVHKYSSLIKEFMFTLYESKIIIEAFIVEPTWVYKPDNINHDIFIYSFDTRISDPNKEDEEFFKLSDKPYWDYKNDFDK